MYIDYNILITYGGVARKLAKGENVFEEGNSPRFFYQIIEGEIKIFSSNIEGKELAQAIYVEGESFGGPPLLLEKPYPSTAQATVSSVVMRISRENFIHILNDFPEISRALLYSFAERIYEKSAMAQVWVGHSPEEKIEQFLIKNKQKNVEDGENEDDENLVLFTRQQIADFTGLRVETVIRTLKKMSESGKVKIINHKLYY